MPPPAPREIEGGYARKLLRADAGFIKVRSYALTGLISTLAGALLSLKNLGLIFGLPLMLFGLLLLLPSGFWIWWRYHTRYLT